MQVFHISPLIRVTLLLLYTALTFPLPYLAKVTAAPIAPSLLILGIVLGGLFLYAVLTEQVLVNEVGIEVTYPRWVKWMLKRGWFLPWHEIDSLRPRWTGQGGIVYYFTNKSQSAYLLPMRIAGFAQLLRWVESKTDIDTQDVTPLAQPWMYFILLGFTLVLLVFDGWVIFQAPMPNFP